MRGRGGLANAEACVNFACKRQNFADAVGEGSKLSKILRTSFMDGPLCVKVEILVWEIIERKDIDP
jgi:hypothetical protein